MARRPVFLVIVALLVLSAVGGAYADRWARAHRSADARDHDLLHAGTMRGDEARYWGLLQAGPVTVPLVLSFLQAHQSAVEMSTSTAADFAAHGSTGLAIAPEPPAVDEATIDAFLARPDLPPGLGLIGRYWRGFLRDAIEPTDERALTAAADADPPLPFANHCLGHAEMMAGKREQATERLLREGMYFHERAEDAQLAIEQWVDDDDWDRIDHALSDKRVADLAPAWVLLRSALRTHDWRGALRAFPRSLRPSFSPPDLALATIAALAWGTFCARLGGVSMRPSKRIPVYLLAFGLGVASVSLTLAIVALEEVFLKMNASGDPVRDFLFFTFGVGLREELSKIAFFAPLLFFLRRKGSTATRLDVIVCGALVGLGFAAEENLGYLGQGVLSTPMARFLTANFFHMSMTAILAGALDDMVRDEKGTGEDGSLKFSLELLFVAAMHGVYDFCLSMQLAENMSYFSMLVFVLLTRKFLTLVSAARAREQTAHPRVLETFALGVTVVVGTSYVYASAIVGPKMAAAALAEGMLGLAIILIVFVQELRRV